MRRSASGWSHGVYSVFFMIQIFTGPPGGFGHQTFGLLGTPTPTPDLEDGTQCSTPPCHRSSAKARSMHGSSSRLLPHPTATSPPHAHLGSYTSHRRILIRPLLHLGLAREPPEDVGYPLMYITSAFLGEPRTACTQCTHYLHYPTEIVCRHCTGGLVPLWDRHKWWILWWMVDGGPCRAALSSSHAEHGLRLWSLPPLFHHDTCLCVCVCACSA